MVRPVSPPRHWRRFVFVAAAVAAIGSISSAFAVGEAHYAGASARLAGRVSIEKRSSMDLEQTVAILRLQNPISLLHRSQYPGEAPQTESGEILLRGGFTFPDFVSCDAAATGVLDFGRSGSSGLPNVEMHVQQIECRDSGRRAGSATPDPLSANIRLDPYECEPSPRSSVWVTRRWSPYSEMDPEMWKAADLLMRDDVVARWPFDQLRSLSLRLFDARTRLVAAFPEVRGEWEMEYVPRLVEVEFVPDVESRLHAIELEDDSIRRLTEPIDDGLEKVCEGVCSCTIILDRNASGRISMAFSPTTNLLYAVRRLRELPGVRSARLVRMPPSAHTPGAFRGLLRARKLPAAFHLTFESTEPATGLTAKRFFVVDDASAREVSEQETRTLLSFDPPPLPSGVWQ